MRRMLAGAPSGYVSSSALASSLVVSPVPCIVRGVGVTIDHNLAAQLLYVQVLDATAEVSGGGAITPIAIVPIDHKNNTVEHIDIPLPIGGVSCHRGCVVQVSSTEFTGTPIASAATIYAFR